MVFGLAHFCLYTLPLNKEQREFGSLTLSLSLGPKPKKHHAFLSTMACKYRRVSCMFSKTSISVELECKVFAV